MIPLLCLFSQTSFPAEEQLIAGAAFHENVEVRSAMSDSINAPLVSLLTRQKEIHSQILSPAAVEFELRKSEDAFYLLFKNELNYLYPVWGRGNYIIKRDLRSGEFVQIKIFLQNDEWSYIRLFPLDNSRTSLELTLYGVTLYDGIVLPVPIRELAVSSFARIMFLTRDTIRWKQIFTDAGYGEWKNVARLVSEISGDLDYLDETDDGAQDGDGRFVLIETGQPAAPGEEGVNCSGFAKWVADGLLLARGKIRRLEIEPLKVPSDQQAREDNPWSRNFAFRDPYFGLDWSRNLALALRNSEPGVRTENPRELDVKSVPFFMYRENIGYELDNLKTLMYLQAVKEPGYFYLGAINSLYGEKPVLWQYFHVALFFPWFDENGDFHLDVLETGDSSSLENLKYRYPGSFVHLSKVKAAGEFISPRLSDLDEIHTESADQLQ